MSDYTPPFTISNTMLDLVSEISEKIGKIDSHKLYRINQTVEIKDMLSSNFCFYNYLKIQPIGFVSIGCFVLSYSATCASLNASFL